MAFIFGASQAFITGDCFYYFPKKDALYNLDTLKIPHETVLEAPGGKIVFNFCNIIKVPRECKNTLLPSFAYYVSKDLTCRHILSRNPNLDIVSLRDATNNSGFTRRSFIHDFSFEMVCNPTSLTPVYTLKGDTIVTESKEACGIPFKSSRFYDILRLVMLGALMFWGIFIAFFGGYWWNKIVGVFGFTMGASSVAIILGVLILGEEAAIPWYAFVISFALIVLTGLATAYIFIINTLVSSAIAGFFMGTGASLAICTTLGANLNWITVCAHLATGLLCGFIAMHFLKWILAILTSTLGSATFTWALCLLWEKKIKTSKNSLEHVDSSRKTSPYCLAIFVVMTLIGMIFQFYMISQQKRTTWAPLAYICS